MSNQSLVSSSKTLSLLTIASHDLRQTINAIMLCVDAMEKQGLEGRQKEISKTLRDSVNALGRMLDALLNIASLENGSIQPNREHFKLEDLLLYLRPEYQGISQQRKLNFQCAETKWIAYTDPILLETIIRNLLANAFRYTSAGEGVWVICRKHNNGTIAIEIGDTGLGIPEDQYEKIFNPNYQISNCKNEASQGFGLGLTIVKKLVEILELEIQIDSKLNCGSRFILTVPEGRLIA